MIIKIAEYKVTKEALDDVVKAIAVFVLKVRQHEPETLYEAFRKNDTLEFIHLMKFPDALSEKKHARASYTEEFVKVLYPNCEK